MRRALRTRLIHPDFGDPGVYVELAWSGRGLLIDLPPLGPLAPRERLKVTDVLVSHCHMDHFSGFDVFVDRICAMLTKLIRSAQAQVTPP